MSGTGHEVARLLHQTPEQRKVAVTFPDGEQGRAAEQVIRRVMELLPQLIREPQQKMLKKSIEAFLASVTPRKRLATRPVRASGPTLQR